ncbi:hypothetical protein [Streptomyces sp. CB03911]|uniref:hypothetical protein n=1 Tax=Streptomyces sp. CB03911 TaxID=1804758 RepID=UPI0009403AF5|nr:hypothetical protein [Streptomyces sp. CB03911]OKI14197.1 hypothetical protein A6A07_13680 [Streptomyces sp. CB03911]
MNVYATAALNNAKTRLQIGWPLLLLAIALYSPADGITRLLLLAAGAALLIRAVPATGRPKKPAPAAAKPKPAPKGDPRKTIPAPTPKVPPQRRTDGRWTK